MKLHRFAAPALAVLVALGASGCAGLSFNTGCGFASADPMLDGASRMNRGFQLTQVRAQQQASQQKAMMVGAQYSRDFRKPGMVPMTRATSSSPLCFR
jgi:hypothetical protein